MRAVTFLYGVVSYIIFLASFLFAIGFVGNLVVPKSIDSGVVLPFGTALLIDAVLMGLFAVQHSVMARPWFKRIWTKIIPAAMERSTYVLLASLLLFLLYWQWRPMPDPVWDVQNSTGRMILWALFGLGWFIVLVSTFLINHFDLFGLRQVMLHFQKKEYMPPKFSTIGLYKFLRHPIMLGFIIAFWASPSMSIGHLVFSIATTCYILVGIFFEERDMVKVHGQSYQDYRKRVPMLVPMARSSTQNKKN